MDEEGGGPASGGSLAAFRTPGASRIVEVGEAIQVETLEQGETLLTAIIVGRLDDRARQVFMRGQCHAFALAVRERTGWPVVWLGRRSCRGAGCPDQGAYPTWCPCQFLHLLVAHPARGYLDICGLHSKDELLRAFDRFKQLSSIGISR